MGIVGDLQSVQDRKPIQDFREEQLDSLFSSIRSQEQGIPRPSAENDRIQRKLLSSFREAGKAGIRGVGMVASGILEGLGILGTEEVLKGRTWKEGGIELRKAAAAIDEFMQDRFGADPSKRDDFIENVLPEALGQGLGFILTSGLGSIGASSRATGFAVTAGAGGLMSAAQGYNKALDMGADHDTAMLRYFIGLGIGATEALPISRMFRRLDKASGRLLSRSMLEAAREGRDELIQEVVQTMLDNAFDIMLLTDEELTVSGVFSNVKRAAMAGGSAGAILGGLVASLTGLKRRRRGRRARRAFDKEGQLPDTPQTNPSDQSALDIGEGVRDAIPVNPVQLSSDNILSDEGLFYHTTAADNIESIVNSGLDNGTNIGTAMPFQALGMGGVTLVFSKNDASITREGPLGPRDVNEGSVEGGRPKPIAILTDLSTVGEGGIDSFDALEQETQELAERFGMTSEDIAGLMSDMEVRTSEGDARLRALPAIQRAEINALLKKLNVAEDNLELADKEGRLAPTRESVVKELNKYGLPVFEMSVDENGVPRIESTLYTPEGGPISDEQPISPSQEAQDDLKSRMPEGSSLEKSSAMFALNKRDNAAVASLMTRGFKRAGANSLQTRSWEQVVFQTLSEGAQNRAESIAVEVIAAPRTITPVEHVAMLIRGSQLSIQYENLMTQADDIETGKNDSGLNPSLENDIAVAARLRNEASIKEQSLNQFREATDISGLAVGQSMSIRRMGIDAQKYDAVSLIKLGEKVKTGELTVEENVKFRDVSKRIRMASAEVQEAENANDADLLAREKAQAEALVKLEGQIATKIKKGETTLQELIQKLGIDSANLGSLGGFSQEWIHTLGKAAIQFSRNTKNTNLDSLVDDFLKTFNPAIKAKHGVELEARDLWEAINTVNPKIKKSQRQEWNRQLRQMRTLARLRLDVEAAEKGLFGPKRKSLPSTKEIQDLSKRLGRLRSEYFKAEQDASRLAAFNQKISDLQAILNLPMRNEADLQNAKLALRDLREVMKVNKRIEVLEEALRTGVPPPDQPKKRRTVSPRLRDARFQEKVLKDEVREMVEGLQPLWFKDFRDLGESRTKARLHSFAALAPHFIQAPRTLLATADASGVMRQGLIMISPAIISPFDLARTTRSALSGTGSFRDIRVNDPKRAALVGEAWTRAMHSAFSFKKGQAERSAKLVEQDLLSSPYHAIRVMSKLFLAPLGRAHITQKEELFATRLLERMPIVGPIVRGSERHMLTFLNIMRAGVFDEFVATHPQATQEELTAFADFVNKASGRGDMKASTAQLMSTIFFAPRFALSRVQVPLTIWKHRKYKDVRRQIASDMAATAALGASMLALAKFAGFVVGDDPKKADYGKIVIDNTRVDVWGGIQQPMRLLAAIAVGILEESDLKGENLPKAMKGFSGLSSPLEMIWTTLKYKMAPWVQLPNELITGRNIVGEETTVTEAIASSLLPLWTQEAYDAFKIQGLGAGALAGAGAFVGLGVSSYGNALKTGKMVQILGRAGYTPKAPEWPEYIARDPERTEHWDDVFASRLAMRITIREPSFRNQRIDRQRTILRALAAEVSREVRKASGQENVNDLSDPFKIP